LCVVDDNNDPYVSVNETARRLNRSIEQVRRYLREGRLEGRRIGQQWFIEEAAIEAFGPRPPVRPRRTGVNEAVTNSGPPEGGQPVTTPPVIPQPAPDPNKPLINDDTWAELDALREEVRKEGGDLDIVELIRQVREGG
jgi:hypothetical protein